jgi:hypothetical protein
VARRGGVRKKSAHFCQIDPSRAAGGGGGATTPRRRFQVAARRRAQHRRARGVASGRAHMPCFSLFAATTRRRVANDGVRVGDALGARGPRGGKSPRK